MGNVAGEQGIVLQQQNLILIFNDEDLKLGGHFDIFDKLFPFMAFVKL